MDTETDDSVNNEDQVFRSTDESFIISADHQALVVEREINEFKSRTTIRSDIPVCGVTLLVSQDVDNSSFSEMAIYFAKSKAINTAQCSTDESDSADENRNSSVEMSIQMSDPYDIPCDVPLEMNTEDDSSETKINEQMMLEKNTEDDSMETLIDEKMLEDNFSSNSFDPTSQNGDSYNLCDVPLERKIEDDSNEAQIGEQIKLVKDTEDHLDEAQTGEQIKLEKDTEDDLEETQISEEMMLEENPSSDSSELSSENADSDDSDSGYNFPVNMFAPSLSSVPTQNNEASSALPSSDANDEQNRSILGQTPSPSQTRSAYFRALERAEGRNVCPYLQMHPPIWKGTISLKNGHADVDMRLIAGSTRIATACLLTSSYHTTIEITQKIPINKRVFKERHINNRNSDAVTLIALPSTECDCHFNKLQAFQNFFSSKKFSGAVVCEKIRIRGATYVIKFLPKSELTVKHIRKLNPLLALHLAEESYLIIIIEPK